MGKGEDNYYSLKDLLRIMAQLRGEGGCPWDKKQDHKSLLPSLLEETYEVLERIEGGDMPGLCEELGDLLLQIVFHAHLAQERREFSFHDVIHGICSKLIRRHPHVFQDKSIGNVDAALRTWDQIKKEEKGQRISILKDVSSKQPALMWALEVQKKAASVGFDWETVEGAWEKLKEELLELQLELEKGEALEEELGDLFFSLVNVSRFLHLSPEITLRQAVKKFIQRFDYVEGQVMEKEDDWDKVPLTRLEEYWQKAKKQY